MITNMPVNSYRQRHPWGTFPTFFAPCSSWGNNDKVMKQSRGLFGVCVQINKSSGALRFEAKRACTQQCRDIEGEKKKIMTATIFITITVILLWVQAVWLDDSSQACGSCVLGNLFHFTPLVYGSELLHFICSCLIFLRNWFGLAARAGRTHTHWLAVCALAPINSICQFAFCNHTVWLCPSFHGLDN